MSVWGVAGGVLALVALETVVQPDAATRVGGLFGLGQSALQRLLSPTVAGIPDRSAAAATTSTQPAGSAAAAGASAYQAVANLLAAQQGTSASGQTTPGAGQYHTQN